MRFLVYFVAALLIASGAVSANSTEVSDTTQDLYLAVVYGLIVLSDIAYSLGREPK